MLESFGQNIEKYSCTFSTVVPKVVTADFVGFLCVC